MVPKGQSIGVEFFAESLEAQVITTDEELREFLEGLNFVRMRGSMELLERADLTEEVVLGLYYLWRPLKGDPLSIERIALRGAEVEIRLELLADPLGRERPYLMAPMNIVAIKREDLPRGESVNFVFLVNGEAARTRTVTLE